ncbi:MAG: DNA-binding protein [Pedosphaera sp.]|nr:DNA-binding protein [Pedosphaera sp.]
MSDTYSEKAVERALMTKREVAFFLHVSERSIEVMVSKGRLPIIRFGPRLVRFPRAAVEKRLAELTS